MVGRGVPPDAEDVFDHRPDVAGYSFAFGAMGNHGTEIQRYGEPLLERPGLRVIPGRDYRCVAERLGGVLRFVINGQEAGSVVDCLPLKLENAGHVGLYTCAAGQVFRDVRVRTRPTCLPAETIELIETLRNTRLHNPAGPAHFFEAFYIRNLVFILKDITELVEQQQEAERLRALLRLEGSAAGSADLVQTVHRYMDEHLAARITLSALARHLHVSVSSLSHRYREATGESPMTTLVRKRIGMAKAMLDRGHRIKSVAETTGFSDSFHLSKVFKRAEGVSPTGYLEKLHRISLTGTTTR
jgi:AraC-like DNA-binding protein